MKRKNIVKWVISIFMILFALTAFGNSGGFLAGIVFLALAVFVNPIFTAFLEKRDITVKKTITIPATIVAFCIGCIMVPTSEKEATEVEAAQISAMEKAEFTPETSTAENIIISRNMPIEQEEPEQGQDIQDQIMLETAELESVMPEKAEQEQTIEEEVDKERAAQEKAEQEKVAQEKIVQEKAEQSSGNISKSSSGSSSQSVTVPTSEDKEGDLVWVPTKGGTKYHSKASCSNMKDPMQVTKEHAEANGYTPCKKCYK